MDNRLTLNVNLSGALSTLASFVREYPLIGSVLTDLDMTGLSTFYIDRYNAGYRNPEESSSALVEGLIGMHDDRAQLMLTQFFTITDELLNRQLGQVNGLSAWEVQLLPIEFILGSYRWHVLAILTQEERPGGLI